MYLDGKQNRRVDCLLFTLLRLARNLVFDQIQKTEKGKMTHRKCEINKRHASAEESLNKVLYTTISEENSSWKIQSFTSAGKFYHVQQLLSDCQCPLHCSKCNACIHMYVCTCLDASIHCTVCKHVHIIHMKESDKSKSMSNVESSTQTAVPFDRQYLSKVQEGISTVSSTSDVEKVKKEITGFMHETAALLSTCDDISTIEAVKRHMKSAIAVLKANKHTDSSSSMKPMISVAPNALHQKQLTFHTTQRKRKSGSRWAKPTSEEVERSVEKMQKVDIKVCGVCWQEEDRSTLESEEIAWVACDKCSLWVHLSCSGRSDIDGDFICKNCQ